MSFTFWSFQFFQIILQLHVVDALVCGGIIIFFYWLHVANLFYCFKLQTVIKYGLLFFFAHWELQIITVTMDFTIIVFSEDASKDQFDNKNGLFCPKMNPRGVYFKRIKKKTSTWNCYFVTAVNMWLVRLWRSTRLCISLEPPLISVYFGSTGALVILQALFKWSQLHCCLCWRQNPPCFRKKRRRTLCLVYYGITRHCSNTGKNQPHSHYHTCIHQTCINLGQ